MVSIVCAMLPSLIRAFVSSVVGMVNFNIVRMRSLSFPLPSTHRVPMLSDVHMMPLAKTWREHPRTRLLGSTVNKGLLVRLLSLRERIGAQPQRDVGGLHRLPHHPYQVVAQGVQVCLISELGREGFERLCCVVLPAIEAPVYEALNATTQWIEQGGYH